MLHDAGGVLGRRAGPRDAAVARACTVAAAGSTPRQRRQEEAAARSLARAARGGRANPPAHRDDAWIIEHEKPRPAFVAQANEQAIETVVDGVAVNVRIDRIDALSSGGLAIVDYKSGRVVAPQRWFAARPEGIQLAVYAHAVEHAAGAPLRALAFAQLKAGEIEVKGLVDGPDVWPGLDIAGASRVPVRDWADAQATLRGELAMLAREIRDGGARVAPRPTVDVPVLRPATAMPDGLLDDGVPADDMSDDWHRRLPTGRASAGAGARRPPRSSGAGGLGQDRAAGARFLALLAIVRRPEAIVLMTFTRKAAAEMRERVVEALRAANEDDGTHVPDAPHVALTRRLARAALARDRAHGWRLIEQPSRLRIITIDAMATALARQAPLASELGALPRFIDDAELLYNEAAREALAAASASDPHWQTFLKWLDNDAMTANRLIAQMLAARDRWPMHLFTDDPAALRADVERALEWEIGAAIGAVRERCLSRIHDAADARAYRCRYFQRPMLRRHCMHPLSSRAGRTGALPGDEDHPAWLALADWLLTKSGTFTSSWACARRTDFRQSAVVAAHPLRAAGGSPLAARRCRRAWTRRVVAPAPLARRPATRTMRGNSSSRRCASCLRRRVRWTACCARAAIIHRGDAAGAERARRGRRSERRCWPSTTGLLICSSTSSGRRARNSR